MASLGRRGGRKHVESLVYTLLECGVVVAMLDDLVLGELEEHSDDASCLLLVHFHDFAIEDVTQELLLSAFVTLALDELNC